MIAPSETERLAAVRALGLLDTPPELRFDRLTRLAARLFQVPLAFIGLVDHNRVWIKSVSDGKSNGGQFPRAGSFSGEVIRTSSPLLVPDALADPRFRDNPVVCELAHVRFFAGYPLRSPDSHCVGVLALVDFEPRDMDSESRALFAEITALAEAELHAGLLLHRQKQAEGRRQKELLADISQRLRTPLNGILGSCDLLAETELSSEQRGFVDWLDESAKLMLTELDGLSTLAIEPEGSPCALQTVNTTAPIRVLVADDNPVNQVIALQQIGKLGCIAEAVSSGQAALRALELAHFDVILMDCQMPDLDGYAATQEIRRREAGTGARVRIIAVTANVLHGERERCLAAGMDGYLPKPFHQDELQCAILGTEIKYVRRPVDPEHVQAIQNEAPGLLQRLTGLFEEAGAESVQKMAAAQASGDLKAMAASAHMLKGSAVNFGAQPLVDACEEIESAVYAGEAKDYQKLLDVVRQEYLRVIEALKCSG